VRVGADAHEQIAKIGKELDTQTLAACDQTAQYGSSSSAFVATIKRPVTPSHHDRAQAALGTVIIYLQVAVFRVTQQRFPVGQRVVDRHTDRTLGQHLRFFLEQIDLNVLHNGTRFCLA